MKKIILLGTFCALSSLALGRNGDGYNSAQTIFENKTVTSTNGFRIPAITTTSQGTIIAVSDIRYGGTSGNTDMPAKVEFMIKTSNDGGKTWSEGTILGHPDFANGLGITDANIVHNPDTGSTFLFGYQNDKFINQSGGDFDWFVYSSDDGGHTWDKGQSIKDLLPSGYEYALQGPGNGMYYKGTLYVPYQAWDNSNGVDCTSGFLFSKDNGKTWESSELLDNISLDRTSESSVFFHKGKICLAVKNEDKKDGEKGRIVYTTSDNGKTWEKLEENFIPDEAAKCETSTLSLSEDVYLVGFAEQGKKPWDRNNIYVTTNTGKKIKIWEGDTYGYTSMAQDLDNLYVLFEAESTVGDVLLRKFDIAAKEYANLNGQILEKGQNLFKIQNKLFTKESYITGAYGTHESSDVESVILHNNIKFGAFHRKTEENSKDIYRTVEYKMEETSLVLSQDNVITNNDNIFAGYQYTKIKYANGSKNDMNSFILGYSLNHSLENELLYTMNLNGIYNNNKLKRNKLEGLGKTADFYSFSIGLNNEFTKSIISEDTLSSDLTLGLETTLFGHEGIKEKNGNEFNDAEVKKSTNISNKLHGKFNIDKGIVLNKGIKLSFGSAIKYEKELMNVDSWKDKFTVLDVEKEFARPVRKNKYGVTTGEISGTIAFGEKFYGTLTLSTDTLGETTTKGKITYKF
ncbi:sialidase family protein [Cetobacterium ceti]